MSFINAYLRFNFLPTGTEVSYTPQKPLHLFLLKTVPKQTVKIMELFNQAVYSSAFPFSSMLLIVGERQPGCPAEKWDYLWETWTAWGGLHRRRSHRDRAEAHWRTPLHSWHSLSGGESWCSIWPPETQRGKKCFLSQKCLKVTYMEWNIT